MLAPDDLLRAAMVAEALSWTGTPCGSKYWGQSAKGRGCDCKGLVAGVLRGIGRPEGDSFEARMAGEYRRRVPATTLRRGLDRLFDRVETMRPADILLLMFGGQPQHLAIYVGDGRMVHACGKCARPRVLNSPLGLGPYRWDVAGIWSLRGAPSTAVSGRI